MNWDRFTEIGPLQIRWALLKVQIYSLIHYLTIWSILLFLLKLVKKMVTTLSWPRSCRHQFRASEIISLNRQKKSVRFCNGSLPFWPIFEQKWQKTGGKKHWVIAVSDNAYTVLPGIFKRNKCTKLRHLFILKVISKFGRLIYLFSSMSAAIINLFFCIFC